MVRQLLDEHVEEALVHVLTHLVQDKPRTKNYLITIVNTERRREGEREREIEIERERIKVNFGVGL